MNIREKNPDLPVIMATKTDIPRSPAAEKSNAAHRAVVYETYENAVKRGDRNVIFIDGATVFSKALTLSAPGGQLHGRRLPPERSRLCMHGEGLRRRNRKNARSLIKIHL